MNPKIAAGIVLYNPDITLLVDNIKSIYPQVDRVYLYNNNSYNTDEIIKEVARISIEIRMINGNSNIGVSGALNSIIDALEDESWLLILDQDSICPDDMISKYLETLNSMDKPMDVGIICPVIVDSRRDKSFVGISENTINTNPLSVVSECITSGSLVNVKACNLIGKFDNWMFIDYVDFEYCIRLRKAGYVIIRNNEVYLSHSLGTFKKSKMSPIYSFLSNKCGIRAFGRIIEKREVSPIRLFYMVRNVIYVEAKYSNYINSEVKRESEFNTTREIDKKCKVYTKNASTKTLIPFDSDSIIKYGRVEAIKIAIKGILRGEKKLKLIKISIKAYRKGIKTKM